MIDSKNLTFTELIADTMLMANSMSPFRDHAILVQTTNLLQADLLKEKLIGNTIIFIHAITITLRGFLVNVRNFCWR